MNEPDLPANCRHHLKAVESIASTFQKRVVTGLQTERGFVIPDKKHQATETTDFEHITWLIIKAP